MTVSELLIIFEGYRGKKADESETIAFRDAFGTFDDNRLALLKEVIKEVCEKYKYPAVKHLVQRLGKPWKADKEINLNQGAQLAGDVQRALTELWSKEHSANNLHNAWFIVNLPNCRELTILPPVYGDTWMVRVHDPFEKAPVYHKGKEHHGINRRLCSLIQWLSIGKNRPLFDRIVVGKEVPEVLIRPTNDPMGINRAIAKAERLEKEGAYE